MRLTKPSSATLAVLVVGAAWLVHTTAIDRLDVTKLALAALLSAVAWAACLRRRDEAETAADAGLPVLGIAGVCLLGASILLGAFVGARVEGWAPWIVAGILFGLVQRARRPIVGGVVSATAGLLAIVGVVQAFGIGWFTSELSGFAGRRVMATLGNPDLFGICLAGALPFALVRSGRARFAAIAGLVVAAIVLSGSRTAWVMLLPSIVVGVVAIGVTRTTVVSLAGMLLGVAIGLGSPAVDLEERVADVSSAHGTAAGRLYLWRVHRELVATAGVVGSGPEGFRRAWPWAQAAYLDDHLDDLPFHSDLRHAHADVVELLVDWGWVGLAIGLLWALRLLWPGRFRKRGADEERQTDVDDDVRRERLAAYGAIAAVLLGGLASPVLFQPASLFLAAIAAGVLAPRRGGYSKRSWQVGALLAVGLTLLWVGQRTTSEAYRSAGLRAELSASTAEARARYERAVEVDPQNALALVMYARSLIPIDPDAAVAASSRAADHLPTPAVYTVRALAAEAAGQEALAMESWAIVRLLRPQPAAHNEP